MRLDKSAFRQSVIKAISFLGMFFILNFMFSLIAVAICLTVGLEALANNISIYAYYSLAIGVIMHLILFIIEEREKRKRVKQVKSLNRRKTSDEENLWLNHLLCLLKR